jgi:hypothetical protein
MLLPMLAAVIVDVGRGYTPLGDEALIDIHVHDILTGHLPLLGPYSRYGWNHPGPALYFALAPFSALAGGASWGTMAGGACLQAVAVVLLARLAWRRGGLPLLLGAIATLAVAYSTKQVAIVIEPWSPYVVYPFLLLFAFQVWAAATGTPGQIVAATVVAGFLVQTHIGYAPFVVAAVLFLAVALILDRRRHRLPPAPWRRILAWTAGAAAVMWVLPVYQEIAHYPGNLSRIFDFFTGETKQSKGVGLTTALRVAADEYRLPPRWIVPNHQLIPVIPEASAAWLLLPAALLAIGAWAAHRSRVRADLRLVALAGVFAVTGVIAFTGVAPPIFDYLVLWRVPVAVFIVFAAVWAVACWARVTARPQAATTIAVLLVAVIVWCAGGLALRVVQHGRRPVVAFDGTPVAFADAVTRGGTPRGRILVTQVGGSLTGIDFGLVDELTRRGVDAHVDARISAAELTRDSATPSTVQSVWYVVTQPWVVGDYTTRPGARLLARLTPLSPARDRELTKFQDWFIHEVTVHGRRDLVAFADTPIVAAVARQLPKMDRPRIARLAALNREVADASLCRCSLVSVPAAEADR